jgi:hypothetical protein
MNLNGHRDSQGCLAGEGVRDLHRFARRTKDAATDPGAVEDLASVARPMFSMALPPAASRPRTQRPFYREPRGQSTSKRYPGIANISRAVAACEDRTERAAPPPGTQRRRSRGCAEKTAVIEMRLRQRLSIREAGGPSGRGTEAAPRPGEQTQTPQAEARGVVANRVRVRLTLARG